MTEITVALIAFIYSVNALTPMIALFIEKLYNFSFMKSSSKIDDAFVKYQQFKYGHIFDINDSIDAILIALLSDVLILGICAPLIAALLICAPWLYVAIGLPLVLRYITSRRNGKHNA